MSSRPHLEARMGGVAIGVDANGGGAVAGKPRHVDHALRARDGPRVVPVFQIPAHARAALAHARAGPERAWILRQPRLVYSILIRTDAYTKTIGSLNQTIGSFQRTPELLLPTRALGRSVLGSCRERIFSERMTGGRRTSSSARPRCSFPHARSAGVCLDPAAGVVCEGRGGRWGTPTMALHIRIQLKESKSRRT